MNASTTICLVDDHAIVRQGLKELLHTLGGFEVVATYANGMDLLNAFTNTTEPDVYILDYSMPQMDGKILLTELLTLCPDARVLMLTQHAEDKLILQLYKSGARGYLNKNCSAEELRTAIAQIVNTGYYNVEHIISTINHKSPREFLDRESILAKITEQELIFIELVCNDSEYTYEQIADMMGRVKRTIDGYRESLFEKFGLKSKLGIVFLSYKYKLTQPFL